MGNLGGTGIPDTLLTCVQPLRWPKAGLAVPESSSVNRAELEETCQGDEDDNEVLGQGKRQGLRSVVVMMTELEA